MNENNNVAYTYVIPFINYPIFKDKTFGYMLLYCNPWFISTQYIVAVLTNPPKWKMPIFQEKVKTEYCLFQKRVSNEIKITCLNVHYWCH